MAPAPLHVAVVSPQPVVERGLVDLLSGNPDRVTVVSYPDGRDPDVVLFDVVDLVAGDLSGLEGILGATSAKVLVVSRDLRPDLVTRAMSAGADGSFSIGVSEQELLRAVEAAVSEPGPQPVVDGTASEPRLGHDVGLTVREVEVLTLIAQGRSNQQIAAELYLSPNSIKTYVRTAYRKIGAGSRSQAVSWAIRNGFPAEGPVAH